MPGAEKSGGVGTVRERQRQPLKRVPRPAGRDCRPAGMVALQEAAESCLARSEEVISTLRGLAASSTGMVRLSTPSA